MMFPFVKFSIIVLFFCRSSGVKCSLLKVRSASYKFRCVCVQLADLWWWKNSKIQTGTIMFTFSEIQETSHVSHNNLTGMHQPFPAGSNKESQTSLSTATNLQQAKCLSTCSQTIPTRVKAFLFPTFSCPLSRSICNAVFLLSTMYRHHNTQDLFSILTDLSSLNSQPDWARQKLIFLVDICAATISLDMRISTSSSISASDSFERIKAMVRFVAFGELQFLMHMLISDQQAHLLRIWFFEKPSACCQEP